MTDTKHEYPTPSTCRVCREWERDMNGTLAALEQERAISGQLLELAEYVSSADFKYGANRKRAKYLAAKAVAKAKGPAV